MPNIKKQTIVLFPGWVRNEKTYKKLLATVPDQFELIFFKQTDFSLKGEVDNLSDQFLEFLKNHDRGKITLVGHSLGGALAIEFSSKHPEYIQQLYLIDSEGIFDKKHFFHSVKGLIAGHFLQGKKKIQENIHSFGALLTKPRYYSKLGIYAHNVNLEKEAQQISVPTTIIWGERDYLTTLDQGKKLHQLIPGSKLIILPGLDHDWLIYAPEKFWSNVVK